METPGKTQDGKTGATVRYRFHYEKYGTFTITANSPKLGECSTRQNHWEMGKPVQQSDIDFIMRKYGTFTITSNSPKHGEYSTQQNHWENPS